MTALLVWVLVAASTQSPTLGVVAAAGFWLLMSVVKASLIARRAAADQAPTLGAPN